VIDKQSVQTTVTGAGFIFEDFEEVPGLPTPMDVWRPFILASAIPTVRVREADADADDQLDREWLRLSVRNGTVGADGGVLISVEGAGDLPWLKVGVVSMSRASAVQLPGQARGFVALSPNGRASTCVSSEEGEIWILADPVPPDDTRTRITRK
jgi:hypothetical protein